MRPKTSTELRRLSYKSVTSIEQINLSRKMNGLDPIVHKWVECLNCPREFMSQSKGHRMCDTCKKGEET